LGFFRDFFEKIRGCTRIFLSWQPLDCTSTHSVCSSTQFHSFKSDICIPLSWVCDRDSDCQDGEDEDSSVCGNVDRKLICPLNYLRWPQHSACMPRKTVTVLPDASISPTKNFVLNWTTWLTIKWSLRSQRILV
jgi:hypothetical protein